MTEADYSRFRMDIHQHRDVSSFVAQRDVPRGVHVIRLPGGNHVDFLINSDLDSQPQVVFFSGAVGNRVGGSPPPYFSGVGIASQLGLGVVAVSDPTFHTDPTINLAWYGGTDGEGVQDVLTQALGKLADATGGLLFVGGSGGGFASLYYAERVGARASVFAWNPQTNLLHYNPVNVRDYLAVALHDDAWRDESYYDEQKAERALRRAGIDWAVPPLRDAGRVLVLQNESDWHLQRHALPLWERSGIKPGHDNLHLDASGRRGLLVATYGHGHAIPDPELIKCAITALRGGATVAQVRDRLFKEGLLSSADPASTLTPR